MICSSMILVVSRVLQRFSSVFVTVVSLIIVGGKENCEYKAKALDLLFAARRSSHRNRLACGSS